MTHKILHLTLHRLWFDAIAKGEKREEIGVWDWAICNDDKKNSTDYQSGW